jgi:hypothetical protein
MRHIQYCKRCHYLPNNVTPLLRHGKRNKWKCPKCGQVQKIKQNKPVTQLDSRQKRVL